MLASPSMSGPEDRVYTVQWIRSRRSLAHDPDTVWRWAEPGHALKMSLREAVDAAAKMGGVVCLNGVPLDKIGVKPPKRPQSVPSTVPGKRTSSEKVRQYILADRWEDAFRVASSMRLGDNKVAIERAWQALKRPDFYKQVKLDPDTLIAEGKRVLRQVFLRESKTP